MRAPASFLTAEEAVAMILSGATVAVSGFVGAGHPEELTAALEARFLATGQPRDLTLVYCAGQGDRGERGLNHLGHEGLLRRVIGGHWNLAPKLGALALTNKIEAYNFPQGVLCCLLREIAAKRPGLFTQVGLNTFIDPHHGGGRLNERTKEELVERITLDGNEYLRFKPLPITVCLIRATRADRRGNLTMEREALIGEVLPMAQAARNAGGLVIAQVEERVDFHADPKAVRVPGALVDAVVVSGTPGRHDQTFGEAFNETYVSCGEVSAFDSDITDGERRRIGLRALQEIPAGSMVNLGIGLPEAVAVMAAETGRLEDFTLTVESGCIGGIPASGLSFGCSRYPESVIDQPSQFDFYDGGGLDVAVLGAAEVDAEGSVNVASLGDRFAGIGGFANIAQSARRLIFCCTLRARGQAKFVQRIRHVCFHAPSALLRGQEVLYITDAGVFRLGPEGLELVEIREGLSLEADVLAHLEFQPRLAPGLV